jgi:hypothetical protein
VMNEPREVVIELHEYPFCPGCGKLMTQLGYAEVADGADTILRGWMLKCWHCGHELGLNLPDQYVSAAHPSEAQVRVRLSADRAN